MANRTDPGDVSIGDHVIYVDPEGEERDALVKHAPGPDKDVDAPTINLVVVSTNPDETDSYGRQTDVPTSVSHESRTEVHGRYWRLPE